MTSVNQFYSRYSKYFIFTLMGIIVLMLVAVGILLFQVRHRPLPVFEAQQETTGNVMQLTPFETPNLLPATLLRWASKAATTAYTFDFVNYEAEIAQARSYFTDAGWNDFRGAISRVVSTIVQNQLFVTGVVAGTPVIVNEGPLPGVEYAWRVQIPFLVTYQSANTTTHARYFVVMTIVRISTAINPQGIGIDQFIMRS